MISRKMPLIQIREEDGQRSFLLGSGGWRIGGLVLNGDVNILLSDSYWSFILIVLFWFALLIGMLVLFSYFFSNFSFLMGFQINYLNINNRDKESKRPAKHHMYPFFYNSTIRLDVVRLCTAFLLEFYFLIIFTYLFNHE